MKFAHTLVLWATLNATVMEEMRNEASHLSHKFHDAAQGVYEKATHQSHQASEAAQTVYDNTHPQDRVKEAASQAKDAAKEVGHKVSDYASAGAEQGHQLGEKIKEKIEYSRESVINYATVELKTVQWTMTCLSASASMLFALLSYQSDSFLPVINMFVSIIMSMYYFYLAVCLLN